MHNRLHVCLITEKDRIRSKIKYGKLKRLLCQLICRLSMFTAGGGDGISGNVLCSGIVYFMKIVASASTLTTSYPFD